MLGSGGQSGQDWCLLVEEAEGAPLGLQGGKFEIPGRKPQVGGLGQAVVSEEGGILASWEGTSPESEPSRVSFPPGPRCPPR